MIQINVNKKGLRADTVRSLIESALKGKYPDATISVSRKEPAESRSDRFDEAQGEVSSAKSTAEDLMSELEQWKEGLPENLQSGSKAEQLDDAINSLQEFIDACDSAESASVEFPGMY